MERLSGSLFIFGLWSWVGFLLVGVILRLVGVISTARAGVYVLCVVAIFGAAWLVSLIPDRWG